jgi:hypothetical protein
LQPKQTLAAAARCLQFVPLQARDDDPLLAAKKDNKVVVCDLTQEEEQPQWQERKKPKPRAINLA